MDTVILSSQSDRDLDAAAKMLSEGKVVAIPTETVYGLAADALNEAAVSDIFAAKGRPADNPLIVHIGEYSDIYKYVKAVPRNAERLAERFWPGPLTMVLPKRDIIPLVTSGGLDTVGIRFPAHKTAREIIRRCGRALAAPSANLSGSPSPTSCAHVCSDLKGRIPAVVDGGECPVGVESTVVSFDERGSVVLLRPGFVSLEDIKAAVGEDNAVCAKGVTEEISDKSRVLSPGMKYRHYSPKADIAIVEGSSEQFGEYIRSHCGEGVCAMTFGFENYDLPCPDIAYGADGEEQARRLFSVLRRLDDMGYKRVYARCPGKSGVGLAVYNRLLRAAGFEVISLE
ncbi:MAG: L-threonylcarbamoyladenylate synthase [Ruminococcus sp.]|nr:L-threonylcarbamoyladenylate synthase [Ruminococcus sp.]